MLRTSTSCEVVSINFLHCLGRLGHQCCQAFGKNLSSLRPTSWHPGVRLTKILDFHGVQFRPFLIQSISSLLMMIEMICNNSRAADQKTLMPNFLFQDENHPEKPPSQNGRCGVMCTILKVFYLVQFLFELVCCTLAFYLAFSVTVCFAFSCFLIQW